jgi:hypothetical protein
MRRCAVKLAVFLLLGAIGNVAVAWAFAYTADPSWPDEAMRGCLRFDGDDRVWTCFLLRQVGASELYSSGRAHRPGDWSDVSWMGLPRITAAALPSWSRFHTLEGIRNPYTVRHEHAYGWPMRAMTWRSDNFHQVNGKPVTPPGMAHSRAFDVFRFRSHGLPLGIHGYGFALNTIFYAAVLWVVFATPGVIRRRRRRFRGQCIHCGYDLRGQPAESKNCPECGKSA